MNLPVLRASLAAIALMPAASAAQETSRSDAAFVDIDDADRVAIMEEVKHNLVDPDSAQFRWLSQRTADGSYCGMVNAKNSFGGYTGFTPFSVMIFRMENPTEVRAGLIGMGNGNPNSAETRAVAITCARRGLNTELAR